MSRIAVIQAAAPWADPGMMRERTFRLLREAASRGATLAVLPELCTISYDFRSREHVEPHAESVQGPSIAGWREIARQTGMHIVAGFPERAGDRLYNSAALIGPAGLIGTYRKAHLYHFERDIFTPGDSGFQAWDTPVGRIGVLICYDLRFAEAVRILLLRGAQILCVPTTWTERGKPDPWDARGWCGADYLAAGYASSASNCVDVGSSSRRSSPRARMVFAASAHPDRVPRTAWTTSRPGSAYSSTSTGSSACSSSALGTRMPLELPIRTMRALVAMVITL